MTKPARDHQIDAIAATLTLEQEHRARFCIAAERMNSGDDGLKALKDTKTLTRAEIAAWALERHEQIEEGETSVEDLLDCLEGVTFG